jgi:hypothetical protein
MILALSASFGLPVGKILTIQTGDHPLVKHLAIVNDKQKASSALL